MTISTTLTAAMVAALPTISVPITPSIRPTTPLGASPFAKLPHELMAEVFLHLDPHTLYTSIRFLNSQWKITVESHIIPMLFKTEKWRVALRIHRRPRKDTLYGPLHEPEKARRIRVEATAGAWEDELLPPPNEEAEEAPPKIKQHIPLEFHEIDTSTHRFIFSTGRHWYAIYELTQKAINSGDLAFRLEVDFGLVWRFDGDGQEELDDGNGSWGKLDVENGWLSKFYCSSYDLSSKRLHRKPSDTDALPAILNTTLLARRRRLPAAPPSQSNPFPPLYWDDKHIEYLHLELTLGSEFFVRRSARANLLMRALEAEAARRDDADVNGSPEEIENEPAMPQLLPNKPFLHRPAAVRSGPGGFKAGPNGHSKVKEGTATPPRSTLNNQLSPNMSPAEQLQMMARSKAAAKAAGRRHASTASSRPSSRPPSRAVSQPSSLAPSRVTSRAPSRAPSRGPTRPSSPVQAVLTEATPALSSIGASPALPGTPVASPRDLPFFRASALALSTNSPYTREALSGYITPDPNAPLGLNRSRLPVTAAGSTGVGPLGLPTNSFNLRGGGGSQPGGTPIAEFKARLRRAGGFEAIDLDAVARQASSSASSSSSASASNQIDGNEEDEDRCEEGEGEAVTSKAPVKSLSTIIKSHQDGPSLWYRGPDIRDSQFREIRMANVIEPEEGSYQGDLEMSWVWSR